MNASKVVTCCAKIALEFWPEGALALPERSGKDWFGSGSVVVDKDAPGRADGAPGPVTAVLAYDLKEGAFEPPFTSVRMLSTASLPQARRSSGYLRSSSSL